MNDFTKEELEYLYRAIYERPNIVSQEMDRMRNKLQSMIDNYYCEHEWVIPLNEHYIPKSREICLHCRTEKRT